MSADYWRGGKRRKSSLVVQQLGGADQLLTGRIDPKTGCSASSAISRIDSARVFRLQMMNA